LELAASKAGMKVLLVDACRDAVDAKSVTRPVSTEEVQSVTMGADSKGVIAYFSCSEGERSWEVGDLKHGMFFDLVIRAVKGEAVKYDDGQILWPDLVAFVGRNINFHLAKYGRKQTPHFRGESTKQLALAQCAVRSKPEEGVDETTLVTSHDLLIQDFRAVKSGQLPKGWTGDGYGRASDETEKRICLESSKKRGVHWLTLPPTREPLRGDFVLELEFQLNGYSNDFQNMGLRLEGESGFDTTVWIDAFGVVTWPGRQPRKTEEFKFEKINRLRLIREGDSYRIDLNDGVAASTRIDYKGAIEAIRIGTTAGTVHKSPARLYSVKLAKIPMPASTPIDMSTPKFGKAIVNEDFQNLPPRAALPMGWSGDGFSVVTDERNDRRCLEVNKTQGTCYTTLPKMETALAGDFYIDVNFVISGYSNAIKQLHLRLIGANTIPLHAIINHLGEVTLSGMQNQKLKAWQLNSINHVRLIRQGEVYRFVCNGIAESDFKLPDRMDFNQIQLGLTTGEAGMGPAKLHFVKVVSLTEPAKVRESQEKVMSLDFWTMDEGKFPDALKGQNIAVHFEGVTQPALEVTSDKSGALEIPISLPGKFSFSCEFSNPASTPMTLFLLPQRKGTPFALKLDYSKMAVNNYPEVDIEKKLRTGSNKLTIERGARSFMVLLNDAPVGEVPFSKTLGAATSFETIGMTITKERESAVNWRILSFSARVLEEKEIPKPKKP
jgi:hypothetical protein